MSIAFLINYNQEVNALHYPLITPLLDLFDEKGIDFQEVWWVYTDQQDDDNFRWSDTLYYKAIIQKYFEERYTSKDISYHDYRIDRNVKNIDIQYRDFYQKGLEIVLERTTIENIFLLPQGGIDQINHALTLQLVQLFKDKVKLYQVAELSKPVQLEFTNLFLNDLTKHQVIKHLRDFDFDKAADLILIDDWTKRSCNYSSARLNLNLKNAKSIANSLNNSKRDKWKLGEDFIQSLTIDLKRLRKAQKNALKLADAIFFAKILIKQKKYNEVLIKFFTIFENLFKIELEKHSAEDIDLRAKFDDPRYKENDRNEEWLNFLNSLDPRLEKHLTIYDVRINNPNSKAYFHTYKFLVSNKLIISPLNENELDNLNRLIENLSGRRNGIAHNLSTISETDFNKILKDNNLDCDLFFETISRLTGTNGLGIFKIIQEKILASYGETV